MFVRIKRPMNKHFRSRPPTGVFVIIMQGFATGLIGRVDQARGRQGDMTNKVPVRLCGPRQKVWMINWRRLRAASEAECDQWGRETYADYVCRMKGKSNAMESGQCEGPHQEGRQI